MTSAAARCPSCATVFRVVPEQLQASDGWVRCGRCDGVFNALRNLVDLDTGTPQPPAQEPAPPEADDAAAASGDPATGDVAATGGDAATVVDDGASQPAEDASSDGEPVWPPGPAEDASGSPEGPAPDDDAGKLPAVAPPDETGSSHEFAADDASTPGARADAAAAAAAVAAAAPIPGLVQPAAADDAARPPAVTPDFVRHADARARWRRPRVRAALAAFCVAATAALAAQAAHVWRDTVAARWPAARPMLEAMCRAPCRIEAPRDIDGLAVESSSLVRVDGTSTYQLQVLLRNRSALPLAVPALDLWLSDIRGATIARRVLSPAEAGIAQPSLAAKAELPVQVTLATAGRPIAGYTIEIFYP